MKKPLILALLVVLLGCGKDDDTQFYTFSGKVLQYPDLRPSANTEITISTTGYRESSQGNFDLRTGSTDAEGRYEFQIPVEEFATSLFLFEDHPSYAVRTRKSGYIQLPSFNIRGLFTGNPINPGEPILGGPTNPIGDLPEDYFEKEIKLGRASFLSFSAESINNEIDSVYLIVYHVVPDENDSNNEENRFFRSFIFYENYQPQEVIGGFPTPYHLGRLRNDFPMDTTLVVPMSYDPYNKLNISITQYAGLDSVKLSKEINLVIGEEKEVFE